MVVSGRVGFSPNESSPNSSVDSGGVVRGLGVFGRNFKTCRKLFWEKQMVVYNSNKKIHSFIIKLGTNFTIFYDVNLLLCFP